MQFLTDKLSNIQRIELSQPTSPSALSPPDTPNPASSSRPISGSKRKSKSEEIDLMLINELSKENNKKEKTSNELFCSSLVETFDKLTEKRNRMARVEIMQVLKKT